MYLRTPSDLLTRLLNIDEIIFFDFTARLHGDDMTAQLGSHYVITVIISIRLQPITIQIPPSHYAAGANYSQVIDIEVMFPLSGVRSVTAKHYHVLLYESHPTRALISKLIKIECNESLTSLSRRSRRHPRDCLLSVPDEGPSGPVISGPYLDLLLTKPRVDDDPFLPERTSLSISRNTMLRVYKKQIGSRVTDYYVEGYVVMPIIRKDKSLKSSEKKPRKAENETQHGTITPVD
ncbi:hypothetical protein J6590_056259 [Homalodisca vitripennis]|nr:hypothetical protein J6590_056259 [Homalodisca vitripennis]